MLPNGQAKLETRLIVPASLGRHATATLYVEYANTGTAAMPAPILILQSADPDDSDRPLLTLDGSRLTQGFWTSAIPDGFANSVQIYASGSTPGQLLPGEVMRVPVYYAGLQQPWNMSDDRVELEIGIHEAGDTTPIDWTSLQSSLRPSWISEEVWPAVYGNLTAQVGPTWGDYVRMLGDNATYLGRLGLRVSDVDQLYHFELRQAIGLNPVSTLASDSMPRCRQPACRSRSADRSATPSPSGTASARSVGGGRRWRFARAVLAQVHSAEQLADGTVGPDEPGAAPRPTVGPRGRFSASLVTQVDSGRSTAGLTSWSNPAAWFPGSRWRADGKLDFVRDVNGNQITAGYTDGRLTSLTHSGGASLSFTYNAAGRIDGMADSAGRITTYAYDPTNTHLLTVTGPEGTTTYTYSTGFGAAREHALLSVTEPGGLVRRFEYDDRGRLTATYLDKGVERVEFDYDTTGRVTLTDAAGVSGTLSFDHRGLIVRSEDSAGAYTRYEYNDAYQLIRETDALGRSRSYTWCGCGSLKTVTDEYGRTTTFALGGPNNQPTAFTDAEGNTVRYAYNSVGDLTGTTYPDGSVERIAYEATGNPNSLVNRRGQAVGLTHNDAGQVTQETYPDGSKADYTYDGRWRLESATDARGTTSFSYDGADRLTRVEYPNGRWLEFRYDDAGRRDRLKDQSGFVVKYGYDDAGAPGRSAGRGR